MARATVIPPTVNTRDSTRTAPHHTSRTDLESTIPTQTANTPMMHPDDEANSDAPLVPRIQTPNRPTFTAGSDAESLRRELRELRARVDDLEADLTGRGDT